MAYDTDFSCTKIILVTWCMKFVFWDTLLYEYILVGDKRNAVLQYVMGS